VDFKLELVLVPVSDVDAAKTFYIAKAGFTLDVDHRVSDELRIVQPTSPGSACSITIGDGDHGSGAGLRFSSPGWTAPGPGQPSPGQRGYPESVPPVRLSRSGGRA